MQVSMVEASRSCGTHHCHLRPTLCVSLQGPRRLRRWQGREGDGHGLGIVCYFQQHLSCWEKPTLGWYPRKGYTILFWCQPPTFTGVKVTQTTSDPEAGGYHTSGARSLQNIRSSSRAHGLNLLYVIVPKKGGGRHLILDLRGSNRSLKAFPLQHAWRCSP